MAAAEAALRKCQAIFPHLERQRSIVERRFRQLPDKFYVGRRHKQSASGEQRQSKSKRSLGASGD